MALKVFLDTEFTNFIDTELISIGLVAEMGESFYAEVPYKLKKCSEFVKEVVIPLLDPDTYECTASNLNFQLNAWLSKIRPGLENIEICFDYPTDWTLFCDALDGCVPYWCLPRLVWMNINELLRYEFHQENNLPEHHALNDAMAMRFAFRERP